MYIAVEAPLIIKQVEFIAKKKFVAIAFDAENKIFVVNVASLAISDNNKVYSFYKAQIALLEVDKAFIIVFMK